MYVRRERKPKSDGQERTYISLAHNVWEAVGDGKKRTKPVIFSRLGVEQNLDMPTVRGMRDALDRYLIKRFGEEAVRKADQEDAARQEQAARSTPEGEAALVISAAAELRPKLAPLRFLTTVEYGLRTLVEPVWERLGLKEVMQGFAAQHRIRFDFERVVFGMVLQGPAPPAPDAPPAGPPNLGARHPVCARPRRAARAGAAHRAQPPQARRALRSREGHAHRAGRYPLLATQRVERRSRDSAGRTRHRSWTAHLGSYTCLTRHVAPPAISSPAPTTSAEWR